MNYEVYYIETVKKKCLVEADDEADAKQKFENGEADYHEYVFGIEEKFDSAIPVDDEKDI